MTTSMWICEKIIRILKESMSSGIDQLLKRGDEGAVVLAAHKNPRFVEDCVREMAKKVLTGFSYLPGDAVVTIKQTNEESIHQHDAYAERKATHCRTAGRTQRGQKPSGVI